MANDDSYAPPNSPECLMTGFFIAAVTFSTMGVLYTIDFNTSNLAIYGLVVGNALSLVLLPLRVRLWIDFIKERNSAPGYWNSA